MKTNVFKKLDGKKLKIAIVQARFNEVVTDGLKAGAVAALKEAGVLEKNIQILQVPGAFEIPLVCKKIALAKKFDGIIALGAIIKGDTAHFEYVAGGTTTGIMGVMLETVTPIAFGVLTTEDKKQAEVRSRNDQSNKGKEAASALIETIGVIKNIEKK
ncbi:MAG: 6,7-dimethyl-8-ribityllumazine synthase [Parcubacteria group bacterium GW2011_GWE2_39_37]|uniref:6,7-dimethyl-8-ribityllumazine synthase n=1 Tax=Candidatus Falkowbacteria bacterium GW2011_GWF2_39_8 TaxID=1618642 RepID=A0A0G0PWN9_9BACT|nr:MAG: 6,7-dimethyl-8-ribityllumazine synthase [Parcubacteria group bacterium GW2011_GWE2_39_37]KKR32313.1 MAG: 6,7-dimethyl-8-ribityllumazine synthase [Candidatus Falkowbacteria bacterium GW2011_GWF2_39_8]